MKGYSGASYKKFSTLPEAEAFTGQQNPSLSPNPILEPKSRQVLPASQRSIGERNIVYTDGSCLRNGQNGATAGYGVYFPESSRYGYYAYCDLYKNFLVYCDKEDFRAHLINQLRRLIKGRN